MERTQGQLFPGVTIFKRGSRFIAVCVAALLILESAGTASAQQSSPPVSPASSSQAVQPQNAQKATALIDPTTQPARDDSDSLPSAPTPMLVAQQEPAQQPAPPQQQPPAQQQTTPQQPVGTAAAPYEKPTGVAGSRPAGAAIAPAKQRRVRAIVVRVALVLAAGAAVGTVVGLSKATHSAPQ